MAIDDHSRLAFSSVHPDESDWSACLALLRTVRYYASLGIRFSRVLTDNGACYWSRRFQRLCQRLRLTHRRTRPYSPRTNGKAAVIGAGIDLSLSDTTTLGLRYDGQSGGVQFTLRF